MFSFLFKKQQPTKPNTTYGFYSISIDKLKLKEIYIEDRFIKRSYLIPNRSVKKCNNTR